MDAVIVIVIMIVVGAAMGWLGKNVIWKDDRKNDMVIGVITAVIVGLMDWYLIPWMGMSQTWRYIGVAVEPALSALLIMWLVRYANKNR